MKNLFIIKQAKETFAVIVPPSAEVPKGYRPGERWSKFTEQMLNSVDLTSEKDWIYHRDLFEDETFNERVVNAYGREVRWGIAAMHKANVVEPSPFVQLDDPVTSPFLSLELFRQGGGWVLGRLYHGENYIPPMPWQKSARSARGGLKASEEYWSTHALAHQSDFVLDRRPFERLDDTPPDWACKLGW